MKRKWLGKFGGSGRGRLEEVVGEGWRKWLGKVGGSWTDLVQDSTVRFYRDVQCSQLYIGLSVASISSLTFLRAEDRVMN